jgi:hypothetical protein
MKNVIWIASYPRSGSTWFRYLLTFSLFVKSESSENIFLPKECIPDMHQFKGISSLQTPEIGWHGQQVSFFKTHKCELPYQEIEQVKTLGFIYLYRHPLDVLLSAINHLYRTNRNKFFHDQEVHSADELKADGKLAMYVEKFSKSQLKILPWHGFAGTYQENVSYWLNLGKQNIYPISLVFKYEDLFADTFSQLSRLKEQFIIENDQIRRAITLSQNYTNDGGKFYWKKKSGNYKEYLDEETIIRFNEKHQVFLEQLGYL